MTVTSLRQTPTARPEVIRAAGRLARQVAELHRTITEIDTDEGLSFDESLLVEMPLHHLTLAASTLADLVYRSQRLDQRPNRQAARRDA